MGYLSVSIFTTLTFPLSSEATPCGMQARRQFKYSLLYRNCEIPLGSILCALQDCQ